MRRLRLSSALLRRDFRPLPLRPRARLRLHGLEDRAVPATFTVTNTLDGPVANPGDLPGSLRQAIFDANALAGADDIVFDASFNVAQTIKLTAFTLVPTEAVKITGPGQNLLTIDGDKATNIFFTNLTVLGTVTITDMTLTNAALTGNNVGAGIGTALTDLVLTNVTLKNMTSEAGGTGIFLDDGSVTATNCTFDNILSAPGVGNFNVGAAVSVLGTANATFTNCVFTNNKSIAAPTAAGFAGAVSSQSSGNVLLDGCTVTGNSCNANGGAFVLFGTGKFTVQNSTIANNSATSAGGLMAIGNGAIGGQVNFINCNVSNNSSGNAGGVVAAFGDDAAINLTGSTFSQNSAPGGGVVLTFANYTGNITFTNSTFSKNTAGNLGGGVLHVQGNYGGTITIDGSTLAGSVATGQSGGAIYLAPAAGFSPPLNITNSTFQGNSTTVNGGAIRVLNNYTGAAVIRNSTFAGNLATGTGGALSFTTGAGGTVTVESTIVATNKAGGSATAATADIANTTAAAMTVTNSLIGVVPAIVPFNDSSTNKKGTTTTPLDPLLLPLGNYGGLTPTMIPQAGSPAINNGSNPAALANDQRGAGFPRSFGGGVDIGAVEANNPSPFITGFSANNVTVGGGTTYQFTITFADNNAINVSTLSAAGAVTVTGPGGFSQNATFKSVDFITNGTPRTATYEITAPGGTFDLADNGLYTITVNGGKIFDTDLPTPLSVATQKVGTFVVGLPQTFVVNATNDELVDTDGKTSLREALALANTAFGADSITFDPVVFAGATTITLTVGSLLSVNDSVNIIGPTADLTLDANLADRHMSIVGAGTLNVAISNITFINGAKSGLFAGFDGGSIFIDNENVTLTNCVFKNNTTQIFGGAVAALGSGNLTITDCVFESNIVGAGGFGGGAVHYGGTGTVTITDSTFTSNSASGAGGALNFGSAASVTITRTTVSGNSSGTSGGGLYFNLGGTLLVDRSTISGNTALTGGTGLGGGGIYFYGPSANFTVRNSTISGNVANDNLGGGSGGGILINAFGTSTLVLQNSTIAFNDAGKSGGGVYQAGGDGTWNSTIVAKNTVAGVDAPNADVGFFAPTTIAGNNNLIGVNDVATQGTFSGTNQIGTFGAGIDPLLDVLANNGGPTLTHALKAGSPAINAGNNVAGLTTDQRGFQRVAGGTADVGAYEFGAVIAPPPTVTSVKVNGVGVQRSMVTSLVVTFSEAVTFLSGINNAFQLARILPQPSGGPSAGAPLGLVNINAVQVGNTVTITFLAGGVVPIDPAGSLIDGNYQLTILASEVLGAGGNLDGDGNGTGGDNYQTPATGPSRVFRIFGDGDGDGDVDAVDFGQFRGAFGGANATFDYDGDGDVDAVDFGQFRARFGSGV